MSGWVKWEKDLETDPRFIRLVRSVRNTCVTGASQGLLTGNAVVSLTMGCLLKLWAYADTHIRADDTLDLCFDDIDELVGLSGFAKSMPKDWLIAHGEECVELPEFQIHNGVKAKKCALSQKRMANKRERDRDAGVTQERNDSDVGASPDQTRPDQTKTIKNTTAAEPPAREKSVKVSRETDAEWLLEFKLLYPNRAGDQRWRRARKAANARMAEGHAPHEFIAGAKRYAEFCRSTGKEGTEWVKQAATFLGPDKPFLLPWALPATQADNRLSSNIAAAEEFLRRTENVQ